MNYISQKITVESFKKDHIVDFKIDMANYKIYAKRYF